MVKCVKCKKRVCPKKAMYYKEPLNKLCNDCRQEDLMKEITIERLKQIPDNLKISIG